MKSHGLKLLECCISLSQINAHTIENSYSIYTLAVRRSFLCNLLLCYKNQIFGIYKCIWLIWTIVTGIILSLFPTRGVILSHIFLQDFRKEVTPMQVIHELSWLWKGIGIIALASAIVLIAAFKLHKEEYKIEIACIILIVTILICIIAMILCARVPMPI